MGTPLRAKPPVKAAKAKSGESVVFMKAYRQASLKRRTEIERTGVPYAVVEDLGERLRISSGDFLSYLGVPKATYSKKKRNNEPFAGSVGHAALGMLELAEMVRSVVAAGGADGSRSFDVEAWLGEWMRKPQPALGGMTPGDLMDTPSGRTEVRKLLGAAFSGSFV